MTDFSLPPLGRDVFAARPPVQGFGEPMRGIQDPQRGGAEPNTVGDSPTSAFGGVLDDLLELRNDMTQKTRGLALGDDVELHDVMMATSKSEVAFNLMLEVRNKLVDAWEKLSRSAV